MVIKTSVSKSVVAALKLGSLAFGTLITLTPGVVSAQPASVPTDIAQGLNGFQVDVRSVCIGDELIFTVKNLGLDWPKTSSLEVYRTANRTLVRKRKLRLNAGEEVRFRVRNARRSGELGLVVRPTWTERLSSYDVTAKC